MIDFMKKMQEMNPDIDWERHHFSKNDIVTLENGAKVIITLATLYKHHVVVLKSGFGMKKGSIMEVDYLLFPKLNKGEFTSEEYIINKSLKWNSGDIIIDPEYGHTLVLMKEEEKLGFHAHIIASKNEYYVGEDIYIKNPYSNYIYKNW